MLCVKLGDVYSRRFFEFFKERVGIHFAKNKSVFSEKKIYSAVIESEKLRYFFG